MQAGFRYEYTDTYVHSGFGDTFIDREYGNLFPSLFLGYKLNDFNNLNISYSKRISRPAFTDMAPMLIFLDLNTAVFGNLSLKPSYLEIIRLIIDINQSVCRHNIQTKMMFLPDLAQQLTQKQIL